MTRKLIIVGIVVLVTLLASYLIPALGADRCQVETDKCIARLVSHYERSGYVGFKFIEMKDSVLVERVFPNSPADRAGIQTGDVILEMNGLSLADPADHSKIHRLQEETTVGTKLEYTIDRNGEKFVVKLTTKPVPEDILASYVGLHLIQEHVTFER